MALCFVFSLYFIFFFVIFYDWYRYDLTVGSGGSNNTTGNTAVITLYAAEITTLALVIILTCTEPSVLLPHLHIKDSSNNNPCATLYHMDSAKSVISSYYFRQTLNSIGWISLPTLCRTQPRTPEYGTNKTDSQDWPQSYPPFVYYSMNRFRQTYNVSSFEGEYGVHV